MEEEQKNETSKTPTFFEWKNFKDINTNSY